MSDILAQQLISSPVVAAIKFRQARAMSVASVADAHRLAGVRPENALVARTHPERNDLVRWRQRKRERRKQEQLFRCNENKEVVDRRLRPRYCRLGSYFQRPKSSLVRSLACNCYYWFGGGVA